MPDSKSLSEVHSSVTVPESRGFLRRLFAFAGPAYLVSEDCRDNGPLDLDPRSSRFP